MTQVLSSIMERVHTRPSSSTIFVSVFGPCLCLDLLLSKDDEKVSVPPILDHRVKFEDEYIQDEYTHDCAGPCLEFGL